MTRTKTKNLSELKNLRKLLSDAASWNKDGYAVDSYDAVVHPQSPTACRWCLLGAIAKVTDIKHQSYTHTGLYKIIQEDEKTRHVGIANFNDYPETTHADILALIDRTITRVENETV